MVEYDAIIIGAGHNGLVVAGYLARAGWKVLVLERRPIVGGACVTEAVFPGYKVSTAAYLVSLLQDKIVRDLELARYGYQVLPKDPAYFSPLPDGRYLFMYQDLQRTCQEIAKFSQRDAEQYPRYQQFLERIARFIEPLLLRPPPNVPPRAFGDWMELARFAFQTMSLSHREVFALWQMATTSVKDFLDQWFKSDELKVGLATDGVIGANAGPMTPGTAYLLLHHSIGSAGGQRGLWGFAKGGMGAITKALALSAEAHGAEIRVNAEVAHILTKDGAAYGVGLTDGSEFRSRVVVSNADPKRTFLGLVGRQWLEPDFADQIESFKCQGTSFKINLALAQLPSYTALPGVEPGPQHMGTTHISPSLEYIERAWDDAKYGRPSQEPMLEIVIPTAYDPDLAPPGRHIMSIFVQYAPYALKEGSWHDVKERFADRVIDVLEQYAPNLKEAIMGRHILSPLDMEEQFGMTGGNIFHGEMSPDQLFCFRPLLGWAKYLTPIRNLYLCGSGTHPGGGVSGAPGHNAARAILKRGRG